MGVRVIIKSVIARCSDEHLTRRPRCGNRGAHGPREAAASPTVIRQVETHGHCIVNGVERSTGWTRAACAEELQCGKLHIPGHARDADAIVAYGADGAGDVRPVTVVIHRVGVVVDEVPAVDVINIAVAVVINRVSRDLARVRPHVCSKVGMGVVDARVYDADDDRAAARADIPRLGGVDIRVDRASGLPGIVHSPQTAEVRIIRGRGIN